MMGNGRKTIETAGLWETGTKIDINHSAMDKLFIGVDPGTSGGLAMLWGLNVVADPMLSTMADAWEWFHSINGQSLMDFQPVAVIEQVGGYVGKGGGEKGGGCANGSAMFKFGHSAGALEAFMVAARIPYEKVVPRTWQSGLSIPFRKKGEGRTAFKNRLKAKAQQLFPNVKVVLATADCLLLAEYCRRKNTGALGK